MELQFGKISKLLKVSKPVYSIVGEFFKGSNICASPILDRCIH